MKCGVIKIQASIFHCRLCENGNILQAGQNTKCFSAKLLVHASRKVNDCMIKCAFNSSYCFVRFPSDILSPTLMLVGCCVLWQSVAVYFTIYPRVLPVEARKKDPFLNLAITFEISIHKIIHSRHCADFRLN